ncbi:MAG: hypothetical protein HN736_13490 [Anaerolineae bacterium]|jgi:hypothetical protein|nr:hypothetical protein [Anaerolineae bacterium]MBT3714266.1 hypothetical protein [Anaerolineae bacterium]MBT4311189.1 hypothetical protein [Anaerolineae bacterium]MBT4458410.1 hypothetical protein [Anaerolineae bacterium]MBT4843762.1 hypothetical protein [Anaerolineae bacterium]
MTLDEGIEQISGKINEVSASAEIKVAKMSDEEARLSVYALAGEMGAIQDATLMPTIELLNSDGLDIQVFVYEVE